jgi:PAS domain S-box-containing protein
MTAESIRILILEDRPADAELIQYELQEAGLSFAAKVVMTEKDFVREIQAYRPDVILSDYDLPRYNGALALVEARRSCPDTPFILVTGAVGEDRAIEILTQGAKDYVLKGRLQQRLAPAVRRALAEAEEQKARKKAEKDLREAHKNLENQVAERTAELQKQIEHRRRMEGVLLKYNERLELLSYTAGRLLASDKPQRLVEELCLKVLEFLDCQAFFNFLVDENAGCLHLNAYAGIPEEAAREIEWLEYDVAVGGCAARDGCRIVAENIPVIPDVRTELVKSFGIKAYACHPLMEQNRVMGTLSFGTRSRMTFSADDLAIMKAVADQVAIALSRVRIEDALRESEDRYRELVQAAPDAVIVHRDGQYLYANPAALRLYGAESFEELRGKTVLDFIHPDDRAAIAERIEQGQAGQRLPLRETSLVRLDGKIIPIESVGGSVNYEGKPATQMVIRDITERKQAEIELRERARQLEDANRELESFSYSVSHDLRAPLRAIDGYSRMILRQQGETFAENTRRQFNLIMGSAKTMGQLIDDLLALSRLGREKLSVSRLNMEDLVRDVWEELGALNPDRPAGLKIDHIPPGMGDRSLIKQVLINVLSNAVKFTRVREVPLIEVGGQPEETQNVYFVRDNGVGFDMQYHDKLFKAFQRLHRAADYEGTGVGLAIVQRIIHRHGGRIWAEGKVDDGACFYFTLPNG